MLEEVRFLVDGSAHNAMLHHLHTGRKLSKVVVGFKFSKRGGKEQISTNNHPLDSQVERINI